MNLYETPVSRVATGIAAVAMTAITIGVAVVIPAKVESGSPEPLTVAASNVTPPRVMNVFIAPAMSADVTHLRSINVVGVRARGSSDLPRAGVRRREHV